MPQQQGLDEWCARTGLTSSAALPALLMTELLKREQTGADGTLRHAEDKVCAQTMNQRSCTARPKRPAGLSSCSS